MSNNNDLWERFLRVWADAVLGEFERIDEKDAELFSRVNDFLQATQEYGDREAL